jgi:cobyrinic acid a,c-diamide synthase
VSHANGLIIAAPSSNSGKTFITLGLLRAFKNKGIRISSAKIGPDYIDPAFHRAASGAKSPNLDGWAMRAESLSAQIQYTSDNADLVICEGVMGLFDGASLNPDDRNAHDGSSADIAKRTGWPVVIVVDASSQASSCAALVHGFNSFDPDVKISGVIFNKVGGIGHQMILEQAFKRHLPDIQILGYVPKQSDFTLPERHLGLVQAEEHPELDDFLDRAADFLTDHIDLNALKQLAKPCNFDPKPNRTAFIKTLGKHIGVARDEAFAFSYPHLLDYWRRCGAQISFFSPLAGESFDPTVDSLYLPGGYPELHAEKIATNQTFLSDLKEAHLKNIPIFGECGGYMVLGKALIDRDGNRHEMAGLLDLETSFKERKLHLGYRDITLREDCFLGKKGMRFRAHEFHYATITHENGTPLFNAKNAAHKELGALGLTKGSCAASFMHLIDQV